VRCPAALTVTRRAVVGRAVVGRAVGGLAGTVLLAGCGPASPSPGAASPSMLGSAAAPTLGSAAALTLGSAAAPTLTGSVTVLAASSLKETFTALGKQFEAAHPGTTVTFSFGASSALATQITQGAPADVFASASTKNMDAVVAAKAADAPTVFATNVMQIALPPKNPAHIATLADLAEPGVKVALCQVAVPCGATAAKVLANAELTLTPVTREADVKTTLAKVELGEVDAALVYVTDVKAAGTKVTGIEIPADVNASTSYPIATLTASTNAALAKAFVDYVLSTDGATALRAAGFAAP
jgi:molybdate transport system substrate-binding protein